MEQIELSSTSRAQLLRIPPLNNLTTEGILEQLDYTVYQVAKGEVVAQQSEPCRHLYILLEGRLRVDIVDAFGVQILIEHIQAPRPFATPHLFCTDNTLPATFTALEAGILFCATRESAFRLISHEPSILRDFLNICGNCNHCTTKRLRVLSYKGIRERLAVYLLDRLAPGEERIHLVHNHSQLAEYLNITRPALSKEIHKLKREGILVVEGATIGIVNLELLRAMLNRANQ